MRGKEIETKELMEIISQVKSNNLDLEKLYDVSSIKIEAIQLREERDELKIRLSDVEGAHQLLEGTFLKIKILKISSIMIDIFKILLITILLCRRAYETC